MDKRVYSSQQFCEVGVIAVLILHAGELRQSCWSGTRALSIDSNPGIVAPELLTTLVYLGTPEPKSPWRLSISTSCVCCPSLRGTGRMGCTWRVAAQQCLPPGVVNTAPSRSASSPAEILVLRCQPFFLLPSGQLAFFLPGMALMERFLWVISSQSPINLFSKGIFLRHLAISFILLYTRSSISATHAWVLSPQTKHSPPAPWNPKQKERERGFCCVAVLCQVSIHILVGSCFGNSRPVFLVLLPSPFIWWLRQGCMWLGLGIASTFPPGKVRFMFWCGCWTTIRRTSYHYVIINNVQWSMNLWGKLP